MWSWLLVFVAVFALDLVWAKYTLAVGANSAWQAGFYSMAIYVLGGSVVLGYTTNPVLLIPGVAGAFAGTFYAVRRHVKD